jgi:mRNA-degrading endonuclease RelE of RelBE toxin-antitoxin system
MKSRLDPDFRKLFAGLPKQVQRRAKAAYRLFKDNPRHNSLQFKLIDSNDNLYSIRIGLKYRALGIMDEDDEIVWFWIGTHAEYDKLIG